MEKLAALIDERIGAAFEARDRKAQEEKDPWARLTGEIDRAVAKHFAALGDGIEEGKRREGRPSGRAQDDDDEGDGDSPLKLGILGL